jgi:hypothetical protein
MLGSKERKKEYQASSSPCGHVHSSSSTYGDRSAWQYNLQFQKVQPVDPQQFSREKNIFHVCKKLAKK